MRPPATPQSAFRFPLNHVLGAAANVRILRVISLSDIPIGAAELARRTSLRLPGVARVCERLEDLGVIEAIGRGMRGRQYRRASRFPLMAALGGLFSAERDRAELIMRDVRDAVPRGHTHVRSAWLEGPVALGTDAPLEPLVVGVLAEPAAVEDVRLSTWQRLLGIQRSHDVTLELKVVTMAELATADKAWMTDLEQARPLFGPLPLDVLTAQKPRARKETGRARKHGDFDARSLMYAEEIAERIRKDPSLVEEAQRYIERRLPSASPGERLELEEWQGLLTTMSIPRLRRFLVQDTPQARRLRQSSPFVRVLSAEERRPVGSSGGK
jgi:hypothetical protein